MKSPRAADANSLSNRSKVRCHDLKIRFWLDLECKLSDQSKKPCYAPTEFSYIKKKYAFYGQLYPVQERFPKSDIVVIIGKHWLTKFCPNMWWGNDQRWNVCRYMYFCNSQRLVIACTWFKYRASHKLSCVLSWTSRSRYASSYWGMVAWMSFPLRNCPSSQGFVLCGADPED